MNKPLAINKVNRYLGILELDDKNTHYANNKSKSVWWLNISPRKFERDLHILLVPKNGKGLIWIKIEASTIQEPSRLFKIRNTGLVHLEIAATKDGYMKDIRGGGTGYNFRRHIEHEWDE